MIQLDEIWSFIQAKQAHRKPGHADYLGGCYTWIALDATNKAVIAYCVGKRSWEDCRQFIWDLCQRVVSRPQITTGPARRHDEEGREPGPSLSARTAAVTDRVRLLRWGFLLQIFTIAWNLLEGIIAVAAGIAAGSVALVGFGVDSFIETTSAGIVAWRLGAELRGRSDAALVETEERASRAAGALLLALAAFIALEASRRLLGFGSRAEGSCLGIAVTVLALIIMPALGYLKLRTARSLGSRALRADAYETITCAWLAVTTLGGLLLTAAFGWWWADPVAGALLVPMIVREGLEAWRGEECEHDHGEHEVS